MSVIVLTFQSLSIRLERSVGHSNKNVVSVIVLFFCQVKCVYTARKKEKATARGKRESSLSWAYLTYVLYPAGQCTGLLVLLVSCSYVWRRALHIPLAVLPCAKANQALGNTYPRFGASSAYESMLR